jgi:hypothetical protein
MNKRKARYKDYDITPKRKKELEGFCEQYPEWKDELIINRISPKGQKITGMPYSRTNETSDETAMLAIRRAEIQEKIDLIENIAKEVDPDIWTYIIKSVCYLKPYPYLRNVMGIPCSPAALADRRRYFFCLLNLRKK